MVNQETTAPETNPGVQEEIAPEETLVVIKPGNPSSNIICEFLNNGHRPMRWQEFNFTEKFLRDFYPHLVDRNFFETEFVPFMTSGPCFFCVYRGPKGTVQKIKEFVGPHTDPKKNDPETIRAKHGKDCQNNAVHCSETRDEAEREIKILGQYLGKKL